MTTVGQNERDWDETHFSARPFLVRKQGDRIGRISGYGANLYFVQLKKHKK
jgi:hypothetical protein